MPGLTLPFVPSPERGDASTEYLEVLEDIALPFKQSSNFDWPLSPEDVLSVLNSTLSIYTYVCYPVPLSQSVSLYPPFTRYFSFSSMFYD